MTIIIEMSRRWRWMLGSYKSETIYRLWCGPFAVALLRVPFREFVETPYHWEKS